MQVPTIHPHRHQSRVIFTLTTSIRHTTTPSVICQLTLKCPSVTHQLTLMCPSQSPVLQPPNKQQASVSTHIYLILDDLRPEHCPAPPKYKMTHSITYPPQ